MYANQKKIRHVNGAGEVRYFTPQVASNKSAMKNGGWFPQEEAEGHSFGNTESKSSSIDHKGVPIDYGKLIDERDDLIVNLHIEIKTLQEKADALQAELTAVKAELDAIKSAPKTPKQPKQKDNE